MPGERAGSERNGRSKNKNKAATDVAVVVAGTDILQAQLRASRRTANAEASTDRGFEMKLESGKRGKKEQERKRE